MCVVTKLNFFEGQLSQSVHPDPFRNECLNMIEWLMVSMIPFLVIGFVSLIFLLRKVLFTGYKLRATTRDPPTRQKPGPFLHI